MYVAEEAREKREKEEERSG